MIGEATMRLIDGVYANDVNVIARCHLIAHRGYLSKRLVKSHDCIAKKCPFFEKLRPGYWQALEKVKQDKKNNRLLRKQSVEMKNGRDAFIRKTLEGCGHIHVTSIKEESRTLLVIYYIYDKRVDLTSEIQFLREKLGKAIRLHAKVGSDGNIEFLIRKPRRETQIVTDVRKVPNIGDVTKRRLAALGVYCLEDLFGRNGDALYRLDCELSGETVNRRYLTAYRSAVEFANEME